MKAAFAGGLVGCRKSDKVLLKYMATALVDAIQSPDDPFAAACLVSFEKAIAFRVSLGARTGKGDGPEALSERYAKVVAKKFSKAGIRLGDVG
ncbi:hypothetical protein [Methylobacterium sp. 22177]|uniref:hypothetical protein n=1 Tax=Methylobacterium sp. 22177 TaxID=3453885 RepID=UPI003F841D14